MNRRRIRGGEGEGGEDKKIEESRKRRGSECKKLYTC
jgi:hypothetical protein